MNKLIRPLVSRLRQALLPHAVLSYSQEGEDLILQRIFATRERGFYVDVGAHHPQRFSNTYKFYRGGWRGINAQAQMSQNAMREAAGAPEGDETTPFGQIGINAQVSVTFDLRPR